MSGNVLALQARDYHSDFFYLTDNSAAIRNQPFLTGDGTNLSRSFVNNLTPRSLNYEGSAPGSVIVTVKEMCLVDKNKLLVYGQSSGNDSVFELHQFANNSPTVVQSVTHLATEPASSARTYIMHSCDFTGGAWLRSTNPEEEHAFYDSDRQQLFINNGPVQDHKLISVMSSKRGFMISSLYNPNTNEVKMSYSNPDTFWVPQIEHQNIDHSPNFKLLRLDNKSVVGDEMIFYLLIRRDKNSVGFNYSEFTTSLRTKKLAQYVIEKNIRDSHV